MMSDGPGTPQASPDALSDASPLTHHASPPPPVAYRGRFAPSPTGDLHFGSLIAAVGSYLDARHHRGEWLIRIEDVDTTREVPGSADRIVRALDLFGFEWTGPIIRQSARSERYQIILDELMRSGQAYECSCSRAEIQASQSSSSSSTSSNSPADELRYPGWCRQAVRNPERDRAIRFRVPSGPTCFQDELQGEVCMDVERDVGDFVIRRRDGLYAYQLAVVVDDADQGITHVVRGADLLNSTPRQMLLQSALGFPHPGYAHLPVALAANGSKLSKSAGAMSLDLMHPGYELWRALRFLKQEPPDTLGRASTDEVWEWAIQHWNLDQLRGLRKQVVREADRL